jgi:hypothetical protein
MQDDFMFFRSDSKCLFRALHSILALLSQASSLFLLPRTVPPIDHKIPLPPLVKLTFCTYEESITITMVKISLLLLALPLVSAKMRGAHKETEDKFPRARQLQMGGGGGGCPDPKVSH